ncbi:MAG TPA: hypothetical protein VI248_26025 [Kineosporiaceae bacterium]
MPAAIRRARRGLRPLLVGASPDVRRQSLPLGLAARHPLVGWNAPVETDY